MIDPGESPQCDNTSRPYRLNGSEDDNGSGGGLYILTHKFFLFTPQLLTLYFSAFCASAVVDYYDSGEDHYGGECLLPGKQIHTYIYTYGYRYNGLQVGVHAY